VNARMRIWFKTKSLEANVKDLRLEKMMNCKQFEAALEQMDGRSISLNQDAGQHIGQCSACASLKADLELILASAQELTDEHEPPARMWGNIEYALRMEGVIQPVAAAVPTSPARIHWLTLPRWAMAGTAALVLTVGTLLYTQNFANVAQDKNPVAKPSVASGKKAAIMDTDFDDAFLAELEKTSPAMKQVYAKNLKNVNNYIAEAKQAVDENPSDADAVAQLREAQSQKAMMVDVATTQSMR